jgi:hypothetical protein
LLCKLMERFEVGGVNCLRSPGGSGDRIQHLQDTLEPVEL